jgi:hypothetical protein
VEVAVVAAIIGIVAAISIPVAVSAVRKHTAESAPQLVAQALSPDPTLPQARQLRVWSDVAHGNDEPDGVPSIDELSLVADHVYSFQIALGYDAGDDGDLLDRSATDDEWVGNARSDTRPASIADDRLLRMVGVGVVVGERVAQTGTAAQVFDGASVAVPGIYLATATTKVALRNLNISVP